MRVLAVDAAQKRKDRGWAVFEDGEHLWSGVGNPPSNTDKGRYVDWVVGEEPWMGGPLKGKGFITFCFYNGFLLSRALGSLGPVEGYLCIPVAAWKNAVLPRCARMPKAVFTRNLARLFPWASDSNQLDACGIAKSVFSFDAKQLKAWEVIV